MVSRIRRDDDKALVDEEIVEFTADGVSSWFHGDSFVERTRDVGRCGCVIHADNFSVIDRVYCCSNGSGQLK